MKDVASKLEAAMRRHIANGRRRREIDPSDEALGTALQRARADYELGRAKINAAVARALAPPKLGVASAIEAGTYLRSAHDIAVEFARRFAGDSFGSLRWLWYVRRLPRNIMGGAHPSTLGYDTALLEVLTGRSGDDASDARTEPGPINFWIDELVAGKVMQMIAFTRYISQVHVELRYAGKGSSFEWGAGRLSSIPHARPTDEIIAAVSEYDRRLGAKQEGLGAQLGSAVPALSSGQANEEMGTVFGYRPVRPLWATAFRRKEAGDFDVMEVVARFAPFEYDIATVRTIANAWSGAEWFSDDARSLLMLNMSLPFLAFENTHAPVNLMRRGYFLIDRRLLIEELDYIRATARDVVATILPGTRGLPSDGASWFDVLQVCGEAYPLVNGPVVRTAGSMVLVDAAALFARLWHALEVPRKDGPNANVRALEFEARVQDAINTTKWRPPEALANMRGRTLRRHGQLITDIDALATTGGTLLLVSCRSIVYSGGYDAGDYTTLRNAASELDKKLRDWEKIAQRLSAEPVGDNYDFSSYERLIGVVVTPHVVYTTNRDASRQVAPGLQASVSVEELISWLRRS